MTTKTFPKLGALLDKQDYEYVLAEKDGDQIIAILEQEVIGGAEPEAIGRYIAARIGDHRVGTINRCIGAARHLQSQQQK